jgi:hypothetical protein
MGFNKKILGDSQIREIEMNPENIRYYLKADVILFLSKEIEIKFKEYEKQYRPE